MSKIETIKRYTLFTIGLFINAFGVSFITKASLGTSPISSIPYTLSLGFSPTLGNFTIVFSLLLVLMQGIILRREFKPYLLLQIPVSIVFGYFIDFTMFLLQALHPQMYLWKFASLLVGGAILGFGVFIEVVANVVMLPGEAFVKAVTFCLHTDFGMTKVVFDVSMAVSAALISLLLFHTIKGVREGTLVAAILVGIVARFFSRHLSGLEKLVLPKIPNSVSEIEEL